MLSVPGVDVRAPLDRPGCWRGRWRGEEVDVAVLPVGAEPAVRRAALASLQPLVGAAPGCRAVVLCHDGVAVLGVPVAGRPLTALPALEPGHAVTVGQAVARMLAGLHARGLVWGADLGDLADEVLVDDAGVVAMPLHGVAARRLAGGRRTAADDVHALVALLRRHSPSLEVAADDAATLVRRLRRCARPLPLTTRGTTRRTTHGPMPTRPPPRPPRPSRSLGSRLPVVVVAVVAVLTAWVVWTTAHGHDGHDGHAPVAAAATTDWRAVVASLDAARARGLAGGGPLTDADAPGSAALAADTATAASLRASAPRTVPPVPSLGAVSLSRSDARTAVLLVTDAMPDYAFLAATGAAVGSAPSRGDRTWTITLARTSAGWRFAEVT